MNPYVPISISGTTNVNSDSDTIVAGKEVPSISIVAVSPLNYPVKVTD